MVAIDNMTLALLLHPKAKQPNNPTPVLSEFLILAGKEGPLYLEKIQAARTLLVRPFDERAAIELAAMELADRGKGGKKGGSDAPYQKVKFDRQIVAVAENDCGA
jgi:hypothetical protein